MKPVFLFYFFLFSMMTFAQSFKKSEPYIHTYSIVARDSVTGDIGVAVQSHWFSVGSLAIYGEAGVGVVATQSLVNPSYGPKGLTLMSQGLSPKQALDSLLANDSGKMYRQVAFLDTEGRVATHTGSLCIAEAGHANGKNFSVQANMMLKPTVWGAMKEAFTTTKGDFSTRILAALKAAEGEKGDIRGSQSAAIMIFKGKATGNSWEDKIMDLRVEDHPDPISELDRLMKLQKAYHFMELGDLAMEKGNSQAAEEHYKAAQNMYPENLEMKYWYAINLINNNREDEAYPILKSIFQENSQWKELTQRLVKSKLLVTSVEVLTQIKKL